RLEAGEVERLWHLGLLDPDEVPDLSQHTGELRALLVLRGASDPPEPERPQGATMAPRLADPAPDLGDLDLAHSAASVAGSGTVKRFFLASSTAFEMASGTSLAFP